jgi:hypothetical protein
MKVLIACEYSGTVREAFRSMGHNALSCDLLPTEVPGPHYEGSVFDIIDDGCTYLCSSGLHWNKRRPGRSEKTQAAAKFVVKLWEANIPRVCIENPVGCLPRFIGPAAQWIQPHQFGHNASKKTGLWLRGLPNLVSTQNVQPRMINGRPRWANQTDSGQNKLSPSDDRWKLRAKTYEGIAAAMAEQWGPL